MRFTYILVFLFISFGAISQERDTAWVRGGNAALFIQQVGVKNWAGGGENSLSYGSQLTLFAHHITEGHTWENSFEGAFGMISKENISARKNVDFMILRSKYGNFFAENWQLTGLLEFRTQFTAGYQFRTDAGTNVETRTLTSDFMAPGYLQAIFGVTYRPNDNFSATFSPFANKMTFVLNDSLSDAGAFGVDPGEKVMYEIGTSLEARLQRQLMENVTLKTNLLLFAAYSDLNHIDVFWDLFLDMKINNWLTTNFSAQLIYDHDIDIEDEEGDIGPRTQFRNILNVGVALSFGDKLEKD